MPGREGSPVSLAVASGKTWTPSQKNITPHKRRSRHLSNPHSANPFLVFDGKCLQNGVCGNFSAAPNSGWGFTENPTSRALWTISSGLTLTRPQIGL